MWLRWGRKRLFSLLVHGNNQGQEGTAWSIQKGSSSTLAKAALSIPSGPYSSATLLQLPPGLRALYVPWKFRLSHVTELRPKRRILADGIFRDPLPPSPITGPAQKQFSCPRWNELYSLAGAGSSTNSKGLRHFITAPVFWVSLALVTHINAHTQANTCKGKPCGEGEWGSTSAKSLPLFRV